MRKKPIMMTAERLSMNDVFPRFVSAKIAEGVSDKTVKMYHQHLHCISKHLDLSEFGTKKTQLYIDFSIDFAYNSYAERQHE